MKTLNAIKFRLMLIVSMAILVLIIIGVFIFGYRYLQTVGEETAKRQADAAASEDSISNLKLLQIQLGKLEGLNEKLAGLRTASSLPQFDTEKSLRTIAAQLGLPIKDITFVDDTASEAATQPSSGTGTTKPSQATGKNSKISFQFERSLSYSELIRFLDAIETSTPKLTIKGVGLPSGSSRGSIDPGTLTLELATM